ncbi:MAG: rod shape-determining protein RodA [Coriobacteriia bacterium]
MEKSTSRRVRDAVNAPLLLWVALLVVFGTVVVASALPEGAVGESMLRRHVAGILVGLVPLAVAWSFDYTQFEHWLGPLAVFGAILVVSPRIPGLGASAKGATSWLQIAGVRLFQPSEPAKLVMIIVLAAVIAHYRGRIDTPKDVARVMGFLFVPLALILVQPDLGTGLVFVAIAMGMFLVGGLGLRWFAVFAVVGALGVLLVLNTHMLKGYQEDRLLVFVDPTRDPRGAGYNLAQSKIAIGSGGLTGKGLGSGTQSNLDFVPERHTDFIFAVLGEELGFVGVAGLLALYLLLLVTALDVATSSRDLMGALIVAGVISMWTFQILENIGMTVGMMPITGIPLPFMSYGGSFMVTNLAGTGMLLSVWSRRYGT